MQERGVGRDEDEGGVEGKRGERGKKGEKRYACAACRARVYLPCALYSISVCLILRSRVRCENTKWPGRVLELRTKNACAGCRARSPAAPFVGRVPKNHFFWKTPASRIFVVA